MPQPQATQDTQANSGYFEIWKITQADSGYFLNIQPFGNFKLQLVTLQIQINITKQTKPLTKFPSSIFLYKFTIHKF